MKKGEEEERTTKDEGTRKNFLTCPAQISLLFNWGLLNNDSIDFHKLTTLNALK
jgi:hypothetical protein